MSISNNRSLEREIFYNCTLPRFGSLCQYEINYVHKNHSSLYDMINDYYEERYASLDVNCYTHLQCNRGPSPACLDWREICDGQVDCIDDKVDEKDCWKIEIQVCQDDEFQCSNGQCIPMAFHYDDNTTNDCVDTTDEDGLTELNTDNQTTGIRPSGIIRLPQRYELMMNRKNPCSRGIQLRVWLNEQNNSITNTCLCPPSYYGNHCQNQNQRVSLTMAFRVMSDSRSTLFAIIISLIDDSEQRIIHSYEQLSYLSVRNCKAKFNVYLVYSNRPKSQTRNYSIHIDIYEKISLNYRASFLYPIEFPFLPVHRLAFIVTIPSSKDFIKSCSNSKCIHGKCIIYSNSRDHSTYCQCNAGWSGQYCTIPYNCNCSSDSKCIGLSSHNRSICVCPMNRFGYRCLLTVPICQRNNHSMCLNGGTCIPADEYALPHKKFYCICPIGYIGEQCEIAEKKIHISFEKNIIISQVIFIHLLEIIKEMNPRRSTILRTVPIQQDSVTIYWSLPFHLIFIEFKNKNYYLAAIERTQNRSATYFTMVKSSDHCPNINQLFNKTFVQMHIIRRIKYYHLPCQQHSLNFSCFYDDIYLCFCYNFEKQRLANCFEFNHSMTSNCFGQSVCENGGQCFQDSPTCPQRTSCICQPCFYGIRCQFSSNRFGFSLDGILGYYIQPNIDVIHQSSMVKISLALTIIFITIGYINGILSFITFNNKKICEVGCGLYLLTSSITTLFTSTMFGLKFLILLLAQMKIITNRLFLHIQCLSIDFLLQVFLNMDQWLNACIAVERAVVTINAIGFQKKRSKKIAKIVIIILSIFIISTCICDPFYRRLMDDKFDDDSRIWCITSYSSNLQTFNMFIHAFHFCTPFAINLVSTVVLILKTSHQQAKTRTNTKYIAIFIEQIQVHKHILVAPFVIVILGIPRLVIGFVSKCMNSNNDATFYLIGYFVSFIPPMLTFIIFVMPSKFYKEQLGNVWTNIKTKIKRNFTSL
ncbi:unnamed protein product [Rotaria sordida]|uniref:Uncharacterized protein n=1 Tax=Rotaria sordida TaxID=392033 RepID=A0A813X0M1_9BILA|nr:unnamed protein product [Rotaria sordida]